MIGRTLRWIEYGLVGLATVAAVYSMLAAIWSLFT